jgi:hypothetical protein
MDQNRILELAVEALEKQKAGIDAEIETIRAELKEAGSGTARKVKPATASTRKRRLRTQAKRRPKSAAEKKALSLKMKQVWEKRRTEAAGKIAKTKPKANRTPK